MTTVKIAGVTADIEDPCALYEALYLAKLKRVGGAQIEETEIRSPVMHQRIKVASCAIADIDAALTDLKAACEQKRTGRRPSRRWGMRY